MTELIMVIHYFNLFVNWIAQGSTVFNWSQLLWNFCKQHYAKTLPGRKC